MGFPNNHSEGPRSNARLSFVQQANAWGAAAALYNKAARTVFRDSREARLWERYGDLYAALGRAERDRSEN